MEGREQQLSSLSEYIGFVYQSAVGSVTPPLSPSLFCQIPPPPFYISSISDKIKKSLSYFIPNLQITFKSQTKLSNILIHLKKQTHSSPTPFQCPKPSPLFYTQSLFLFLHTNFQSVKTTINNLCLSSNSIIFNLISPSTINLTVNLPILYFFNSEPE